jgi:hypothetical protein
MGHDTGSRLSKRLLGRYDRDSSYGVAVLTEGVPSPVAQVKAVNDTFLLFAQVYQHASERTGGITR